MNDDTVRVPVQRPADQIKRIPLKGIRATVVILTGVAIFFAAFSAFLLIQPRQAVVLLKAQRAAPNAPAASGGQPQTGMSGPNMGPQAEAGGPVLFKGGGRDCMLYVDGAAFVSLNARVLTHSTLSAGEHYLECTAMLADTKISWAKRVNFNSGGQKIVEIGQVAAPLRSLLGAAISGVLEGWK